MQQAKANYLYSVIAYCSGEQNKLYKLVDLWISHKQDCFLPSHQSLIAFIKIISLFFRGKVEAVRAELNDTRTYLNPRGVDTPTAFLDNHTVD